MTTTPSAYDMSDHWRIINISSGLLTGKLVVPRREPTTTFTYVVIADAILWQEIIAGLQRQLDAQTPQLPEDGAPPPAPEPPPRRNLSDVAEPPR